MTVDFDKIEKQVDAILPQQARETLSSSEVQDLLAKRASRIAEVDGETVTDGAGGTEHLIVRLGGSDCAIDATRIEGIVKPRVTTLADSPSWLVGLFSHRGSIYPLLDTSVLLNSPSSSMCDRTLAVLVSGQSTEAGLLVEEVLSSRSLSAGSAVQSDQRSAAGRHIRGLTDDAIAILDIDSLLTDPRLSLRSGPS